MRQTDKKVVVLLLTMLSWTPASALVKSKSVLPGCWALFSHTVWLGQSVNAPKTTC